MRRPLLVWARTDYVCCALGQKAPCYVQFCWICPMMLDNTGKGNIGEHEICAELQRLGARAHRINQQDDALHWDIQATLPRPAAHFHVQGKYLPRQNPRLTVDHIRDWLSVPHPT